MKFDGPHAIGYVGALGSLVFGINQLRVILQKQEAKDVGVFDYAIRVIYSILLGIYSLTIGDPIFVVVNFGAALLSAGVAVTAVIMKRKNGGTKTPSRKAKTA